MWAHAALRDILGKYVYEGQPVSFQKNSLGKPKVSAISDLNFNLSHSGKWALIVVARGPEVGVDVEEVCDCADLESIARRTFSPAERAALSKLTGQEYLAAFYRCWTRKEAYVKALGLGLSADLSAFDVSVEPGNARLLAVRPPLPSSTPWMLTDLAVDDEYKAAVAVQGTGEISHRLLNWSRRRIAEISIPSHSLQAPSGFPGSAAAICFRE